MSIKKKPACRAFSFARPKMRYRSFALFMLMLSNLLFAQTTIPIGEVSTSQPGTPTLQLEARFQHYEPKGLVAADHYETHIQSPKSALVHNGARKFYVNSLEGFMTPVFGLDTLARKTTIFHVFDKKDSMLFDDGEQIDYSFTTRDSNMNVFSGKPVEMCLSHNGKFLWISYYRRSFDANAVDPSAVAIIDTEADSIVRVMKTGPLPKMLATSPDNKFIAITNWGDNTVHLIDISSDKPSDFKYAAHFAVGRRLKLDYTEKVNRDSDCGYCLRGTIFTPDSRYLIVGRMSGGGLAFFDMQTQEYLGTVFGTLGNVRHLGIHKNHFYLSSNVHGTIQRTSLDSLIRFVEKDISGGTPYTNWQNVYTGKGARTFVIDTNKDYLYATANNESMISIVRLDDFKVVGTINADSYPVGMAIDTVTARLIVTSQGKRTGGGNSVMIFKMIYPQ
jgi:DNA-binding beta-propeller fold protein YncE